MNGLSEIVDSLENRISKLLHRFEKLKQRNLKLEEEVNSMKVKLADNKVVMAQWQEKLDSLKLANSMLGSDQYKRDTKLKINALVREIDHCISQLSE